MKTHPANQPPIQTEESTTYASIDFSQFHWEVLLSPSRFIESINLFVELFGSNRFSQVDQFDGRPSSPIEVMRLMLLIGLLPWVNCLKQMNPSIRLGGPVFNISWLS